jgi:exopolyphosphatase/guanosine-5'-triphosphate,3'-diphosphate pyrophosphatase
MKPRSVVISGNGVREGLFYEAYFNMLEKPPVVEDVLAHSLDNVVKRYHEKTDHIKQLDRLTNAMFDTLKPTYGFKERDRKLLQAAIRVHDIGMRIDYFNHQDHSFYLTLNTNIYGLSHRELVQVAWIAGNHRVDRKLHQSIRRYSGYMNNEEKQRVDQMAALLLIAEQLDRAEDGRVTTLATSLTDKSLILHVGSNEAIDLEIASAKRASAIFRKAYRRTLVIKNGSL